MGTFLIPFNIILKYPSFSEFTTACDVLHYHLLLAFWIVCSGILDFISHPPRYCTRYSRLLDLPQMTTLTSIARTKCLLYRLRKFTISFLGRMALLITLFLVLINIFNNITTNSPKAEGLTAIEIWMLACILFVFGKYE